MCQQWPVVRLGALSVAVPARDILKEVPIIFIISNSLASGQIIGREHNPAHKQNWIKDLLSMALLIQTRTSFSLRESHPSGSFHKSLILIHHRADRLKTTITEH